MNNLIFPTAVLDQHLVILGKTGAGKSSALRHIAEWLLARQKRVCIIDPKGDWWGLKVSADGKGPGFPVVLFGNFKRESATDVPINDRSGARIAELVADGNRPCVIGLRGWTQGAMTRFWIDFSSTLFAHNAGELYLLGDEFHNFAPKQWKGMSDKDTPVGVGLHWANRLLSEGRGLGLICFLASQRPQKVHNDTLTSCETLVAMRVIHKADRDAVKDWIDGVGEPEKGKEVLNSLASMPRGDAWVWSPEVKFGPERLSFPLFQTFDSFAPPQLQKRVSDKGWAEVDLEEVKAALAEAVQEAEANDPKKLKLELAKTRRELEQAQKAIPQAAVTTKEVIKEVLIMPEKAINDLTAEIAGFRKEYIDQLERIAAGFEVLNGQKTLVQIETSVNKIIAAVPAIAPLPRTAPRAMPTYSPPMRKPTAQRTIADVSGEISASQQKVLDALALCEQLGIKNPERINVAFFAGYTVNGHFNNMVGNLRTAGYIDYPGGGRLCLTDAGRAVGYAGNIAIKSLDDFHQLWLGKLGGPEQKILSVLLNYRGNPISRDDLAEQTGYTINGHFNNCVGHLKTLGAAHYPQGGYVAASAVMFPEGLN